MTSAPGRSCFLGLPPAALAFFATARHSIGSTGTSRLQSENMPANRIKLQVQETGAPDLTVPLILDIPKTINIEEDHFYSDNAHQENNDAVWFRSMLKKQETFNTEIEILNVDTPQRSCVSTPVDL